MKADPAAQARLLDLQAVDTALARVAHRRRSLPEHAEIAGAMSKRAQLAEQFIAVQTELSDAEIALKRAEAELVPVRERRERDQERVDAGQGDPKALQAMLGEIEHLTRRIGNLEDAELERMQDVEDAVARRDAAKSEHDALAGALRELVGRRDAQLAEFDAEGAKLAAQRADIAAGIPADLLVLFAKVAARNGGSGAGALQGRRCGGCGLEANAADLTRYQTAPVDEVLRCEECDRILVRV